MKKIPNQAALQTTMRELKTESALLEKKIRNDWNDVKKSLSPRQMGVQVLASFLSRPTSVNKRNKIAESLSELSEIGSSLLGGSISKFLKKLF
jgi:ABC-type antimicrobial peptide transport system ATPase subunit